MKTRYYIRILWLAILCLPLMSMAQSQDQNYIRTRTYTSATTNSPTDSLDVIQYFDGLGRPNQTFQVGITPDKKSLYSIKLYDEFGRESGASLPTILRWRDGRKYIDDENDQQDVVHDEYYDAPFTKTVYESSPLNRVVKQFGVGRNWHEKGKASETAYLTNDQSDSLYCLMLTPWFGSSGRHIQTLYFRDYKKYNNNELFVTQSKDEDGNLSYEFKDKLGQVVLTRQINNGENHDTYYVYDDLGNLVAVLPPLLSDYIEDKRYFSYSTKEFSQYAYAYRYDHRNRCIEKKLPGCERMLYVYDKADQLILSQNGEQRLAKNWTFNKYDKQGRIILSGLMYSTESHQALIKKCENIVVQEYVLGNYYGSWGYTWTMMPEIQWDGVLLVNYYDDYEHFLSQSSLYRTHLSYQDKAEFGKCYINSELGSRSAKGLLVGTREMINEDRNRQIATAYYYDERGRLIQKKSSNHLAEIDREFISYNFTGQPIKRLLEHPLRGTTTTELYTYNYDHAGRLLKTTHSLNSAPEVVLVENTYDDLGRLQTSKQGGMSDNLKTNYTYNIRSWTKSITSPLFSQTLDYQESDEYYNGNVSSMTWGNDNDNSQDSYDFEYDQLSRLTRGNHNSSSYLNYRTTSYSYDKHGNIANTERYLSRRKLSGRPPIIRTVISDDLTITHNGNQLKSVVDNARSTSGFKDYSTTLSEKEREYTYNTNGAMTWNPNKKVRMTYNTYNGMPDSIIVDNPVSRGYIKYTYSSTGKKLRAFHLWSDPVANTPIVQTRNFPSDALESGDAPAPEVVSLKLLDYIDNKVYEYSPASNPILQKIRLDNGYYDFEKQNYYFYLRDHLGNNRVVVDVNGKLIQRNDYYPFGMPFDENRADKDKQPFKFGGKEYDTMHGLDQYDFHARQYDPAISRFNTVDPLAEKYYNISPYVYCANNPIANIDPSGMDWVWRNVNEADEFYYDRSVRSQEDINKKYGKNSGIAHMPNGSSIEGRKADGSIAYQYTFMNDDKNNKYGTVTDMNGKVRDNSQIISGSDYTIFGTSDNSVNAETLHGNWMGSYVGPNNPLDYNENYSYQYRSKLLSDYAAMRHDINYDKVNAVGPSGVASLITYNADRQLANEAAALIFKNNSSLDRARAAAVYALFNSIANFKQPFWTIRKNAAEQQMKQIAPSMPYIP